MNESGDEVWPNVAVSQISYTQQHYSILFLVALPSFVPNGLQNAIV